MRTPMIQISKFKGESMHLYSNKKKPIACIIFFILCLSQDLLVAASLDEKVAFCNDQVRWRYLSEYERTKAYKKCIIDADELIKVYEKEKASQFARNRLQRERLALEKEQQIELNNNKKKAQEEKEKSIKAFENQVRNDVINDPKSQFLTGDEDLKIWILK